MALYVNDEKVDSKQIEAEVEKLRPDYERVFTDQKPEEREKQLGEWSRENVVEAVLLRQAAGNDPELLTDEAGEELYQKFLEQSGGKEKFFQENGISLDNEQQVKKDITRQFRMERLFEKITKDVTESSDKDIENYYEENAERFMVPEMVRAAHIVKHPTPDTDPEKMRKEMDEFHAKLEGGADFAELAGQGSDCADNGGDLGYFARGQMVQGFEDIVFDMEVGQFSGVFETEFGLHIARLLDKKASNPCPIKDVREVIVKELDGLARQKAIETFLDAEKAKAKIEDK
ncbi:MAG: peptidylprolyl isomerase [Planctomycetes bacterium]|nr:peptidylprolyl isomerase [Planctomycetota bacterium]